jgi:hypothetical protein
MDKLQWFKFSPSDWMMGKIQKCPRETRGAFMNLCCLYWNKECDLSFEDAEIEVDDDQLSILIKKKIVSLEGENVHISFLDEQMEGILETSSKRRDAANKRWNKKDATDMQVHASALQNDADKSKRETREDKIKKENKLKTTIVSGYTFNMFWEDYGNKTGRAKCEPLFNKLSEEIRDTIKTTLQSFKAHKPFKDYTHPNPQSYINGKRWEDVVPEPKVNTNIMDNGIKTEADYKNLFQ